MRQTLSIHNKKISFLEAGKGNKNLIFIHGNSLGAEIFSKQLQDKILCAEFTMFAPDLLGYGESDRSPDPQNDYTARSQANLILEFCKALKFTKPVIIAHSLGGNIAIEILELTNDIESLVLVSSLPAENPMNMSFFLPNPAISVLFQPSISENELVLLNQSLFSPDYSPNDTFKSLILKSDPSTRSVIANSIARQDYKDQFEIIKSSDIPVYLIMGERDQLYNLNKIQTMPEWVFQHSLYLIPNAGHMPFYENKEAFNGLVRQVVKKMLFQF